MWRHVDGSTPVVVAPCIAIQLIVFRKLIINDQILNWVYVPHQYSFHSKEIEKLTHYFVQD